MAGLGHAAETGFTISNVAKSPIYVLNGFASSIAAVFGLATPTSENIGGGLEWGRPLLAVGVVLALFRIYKVGVSRQFWGILALGLSFWLLDASTPRKAAPRSPAATPCSARSSSSCSPPSCCAGCGSPQARDLDLALIGVATVASIASNVYYLHESYDSYHGTSILEKSALGAVELARGHVAPTFLLSEEVPAPATSRSKPAPTSPPATDGLPATTKPNSPKRRNPAATTPTRSSSKASRRRSSTPRPPNCPAALP